MKKEALIAGNWKMYKTILETKEFFSSFLPKVENSSVRIFIAPPFTAVSAAANAVKGTKVRIGGQNMSSVEEGAFTGEISGKMLKEAGASFVILGHSERRAHFHETSSFISQKLRRAIQDQLIPILCIGESAKEREEGRSHELLVKQLEESLAPFSAAELKDLVIAYEPVWAIGTGKTATPHLAQEVHLSLRTYFKQKRGAKFAEDLSILYGGSVKIDNCAELMKAPDIDGLLVGGASLDPAGFAKLISLGIKQ